MSVRIQCVTVDCRNPRRLADFWSKTLDWRITYEDPDEFVIEPKENHPAHGVSPDILFNRVDDEKAGKNRWHFDLRPSDDQDSEIRRLMKLGARQVDIGQTREESWTVMADPEGNEFCVLQPLEADEEVA